MDDFNFDDFGDIGGGDLGGVGNDAFNEGERDEIKEKTAFDDALERIAAAKRGRAAKKLGEKQARALAEKCIEAMVQAHIHDTGMLKERPSAAKGKPQVASRKLELMNSISSVVYTTGIPKHFKENGGVDVLQEWLKPIEGVDDKGNMKMLPAPPTIAKWCIEMLGRLQLTKDDITQSCIGADVRAIIQNSQNDIETREKAQKLVNAWVADILGVQQGGRKRKADLDAAEDEAIEVQDTKRTKLGSSHVNPVLKHKHHVKSEDDRNKFWAPDAEKQQKYDDMMKTRHAHMVMEKPAFESTDLPDLHNVPSKRPEGQRSKLQANISKMVNPNKKNWKNITKQISVQGRGIKYTW